MDNYGWSSHPVKSQGGRIMSLQVEKLENNTAKLTIEVEASKFDKAIQKAYQKNKNKFIVFFYHFLLKPPFYCYIFLNLYNLQDFELIQH